MSGADPRQVFSRRVLSAVLVVSSVGAVAPACDSEGEISLITSGGFDPKTLTFGERPLLVEARQRVRLTSPTTSAISAVRFDPPTDGFSVGREAGGPLLGSVLSAGQPVGLEITFFPRAVQAYDTKLLVVFAGARGAEITLAGQGVAILPLDVRVSPEALAFTPAEVGRLQSLPLQLENAGASPAIIRRIENRAGQEASPGLTPFYVADAATGLPIAELTIQPGQKASLLVQSRLEVTGPVTDTLVFDVDGLDPAADPQVGLGAQGLPAGVLECPRTSIDFGRVTRGAARSGRIDCRVVGGQWTFDAVRLVGGATEQFSTLTAPARGTTFTLGSTISVELQFIASRLAGTYNADALIAAASGQSRGISLTAEVAAPETPDLDVSVRLTWGEDGSDLDLHLTRNGAFVFDPVQDCYFAHRNPDWGTLREVDDDPFHDRDDVDGGGPEVVNLRRALEGQYDIFVHAFRPVRAGATAGPVSVYAETRGRPLFTVTNPGLRCGDLWHVARLRTDGRGGVVSESVDGTSGLRDQAMCPPP